eukprot:scaffold1246_cov134-Cylindrotheca_fusiformis.AAC.20
MRITNKLSGPTSRGSSNRTCRALHCIVWLAMIAMGGGVLLTINFQRSIRDSEALTMMKPSVSRQHDVKYSTLANGKRTILQQRRYKNVIYFLHIHKSAGSFLCKQAYENRMSAPYQNNCNAQEDQYCCGKDSVGALYDFANSTFFDFVATERELYESMAPEVLDYVVSLRQSKTRYYSHFLHVVRHIQIGIKQRRESSDVDSLWLFSPHEDGNGDVNHPMKKIQQEQGRDRLRRQQKKRLKELAKQNVSYNPIHNFTTWSAGQPDNWNVRIICGRRCKTKAKFQITDELFRYTLQRLEKFRHVMFVEDMVGSFNAFAKSYEWKILQGGDSVRKKRNYTATEVQQAEWNPMMSALDDALYEFAQRKYNNETGILWDSFANQAEVDQYFSMGPKLGCTDICCGLCTPY